VKRLRSVLLFLLCVVSAYTVVQASRWWHLPPVEPPVVPVPYAEKLAEQRRRLSPPTSLPTLNLQEHRGRVLVICAGSVGNPETESWLRQLAHLQEQALPPDVEVLWLAVGHRADEVVEATRRWQLPFPAHADPAASVAESLGHGLDPTLYVVGKWGAVRYAGDLQIRQLPRMLTMLTKERENGDHQFFSSRGADVGHRAPDFALPDCEGRSVRLKSLLDSVPVVCLLFVGSDLRAGASATSGLRSMVEATGLDRVQACIIYSSVDPKTVSTNLHSPKADGALADAVRILVDESGAVARNYQVSEPPLIIIIGTRGFVRYRGDSPRAADATIAAMLQMRLQRGPTRLPSLPP